jgi:hypothetical protein
MKVKPLFVNKCDGVKYLTKSLHFSILMSGFLVSKDKRKSYFYCGSIVAGGLLDTA